MGEREDRKIAELEVRIRELDGIVSEATRQISELRDSNDKLIEALQAQDGFDEHYADCDDCEDDRPCDNGNEMWERAIALRAAILEKV